MSEAHRSGGIADLDGPGNRKIIHVDMDAFYASVEQRDDPRLRDQALAVSDPRGWGIVATASYEARARGVKSGMPVGRARTICPDLLVIEPRLELYRRISVEAAKIFGIYTDLVEPVMLDEAYLDVTIGAEGSSATAIAREIRHRIRSELGLVASAGVSNSKFVAKLASDKAKPDGLLVIPPSRILDFIADLPIEQFHGVGPATAKKLIDLGVRTCRDLRALPLEALTGTFGRNGRYLHDMAKGIDHRLVQIPSEKRSHGVEISFRPQLSSLDHVRDAFAPIVEQVWAKCEGGNVRFGNVAIKIRHADFRQFTRSRKLEAPGGDADALHRVVGVLVDSLPALEQSIRLLGVSVTALTPTGETPTPVPSDPPKVGAETAGPTFVGASSR